MFFGKQNNITQHAVRRIPEVKVIEVQINLLYLNGKCVWCMWWKMGNRCPYDRKVSVRVDPDYHLLKWNHLGHTSSNQK